MQAYVPLDLFLAAVRSRAGSGAVRYWETSGSVRDTSATAARPASSVAGVEACRLVSVKTLPGGKTVATQVADRAFRFDDGRASSVFRDVRFCWTRDAKGRVALYGRQGPVRMGAEVELVRCEPGGGVSFVLTGSYRARSYAFDERIAHREVPGEGGSASFYRRTWRGSCGPDETLELASVARDRPEDLSERSRAMLRDLGANAD